MSAVGSSDTSNRGESEVARRAREETKANEAELAKRNSDKLRRIGDQHYAALEKLKSEHQQQMEGMHKATNQEIAERDHYYQQEMEEMRGLYKKQLQEQADEASRRESETRKSLGGELESTRTQDASRIDALHDQEWRQANAHEQTVKDLSDDLTQKQGEAIDGNKEKLTNHFTTREKQNKEERDRTVANLQRNFGEYRNETSAQLRDQELRHSAEQRRSSDSLMRAVRNERIAAIENQDSLKEGFQDAMTKTKERFENANRRTRQAGSIARDQTKSSVDDRIENQINRLEVEKEDLKDAKVSDTIKLKEKQRREIANVADSYQKNMDNYREQRDEAVRQGNERTHKDISKVRKDLESQAVETNRFYRQQEDERNMINRTAFDNLKGGLESQTQQAKNSAENRVKHLWEITTEEKTRLAEQQVDNHIASQHSHQDDMRTLRVGMEADKQIAVNSLTDHIQKQELAHTERMQAVVAKYEKQINTLQDQLLKEKKQNEENLKRTTQEMQRANRVAMDQLELQNKDRMREANERHSEEVRQVNKRHEEKLDQVLGDVKRS